MEKQMLEEELENLENRKEELVSALKLLDESINSVKNKLNELNQEEKTDEKNKKIESMKLVIEQDKENLEKNYGSKDEFVNKITDYFIKNQEAAYDSSLSVKDRIKSRMNAILAEYYMTCMDRNTSNMIFFDKMFAKEYRSLSYEYGKLSGLDDDQIINRGILSNNDITGYVLYKLMREGRPIEDIFDNYYIERENRNAYYAIRDEDGKILQPNKGHAMGMSIYKSPFSNSERNQLNAAGIKTDYYYKYYEEPSKDFNSFLSEYYTKVGYNNYNVNNPSYIDNLEPYIREMQPEYSFSSDEAIIFKSEKECKLYDDLMQSTKEKNSSSTVSKSI